MNAVCRFLGSFAREGLKSMPGLMMLAAAVAAPAIAGRTLRQQADVAAAASPVPLDSIGDEAAAAPKPKAGAGDAEFGALFQSWKKLDALSHGVISIPSIRPVERVTFTSEFGVRTDPFRNVAAMHAGIDLAGPVGTPVYATADGMVARAEWAGGYGNLIELDHGKGIHTRFGHLSRILVKPGNRITRGQMIGLMGSTGRSTGSHLHYEVRIDGRAVNPVPYLQAADYVTAMHTRLAAARVAQGGPDDDGE